MLTLTSSMRHSRLEHKSLCRSEEDAPPRPAAGATAILYLIMGVLNNGMSILGLGTDYQPLIEGLVLLVAVDFNIFNKNRSGSGGGDGAFGKRLNLKRTPSQGAAEPVPTKVTVAAEQRATTMRPDSP
jgi:hypothetical protein